MFCKDDQSIELLYQLQDKPKVIPEPLNGSQSGVHSHAKMSLGKEGKMDGMHELGMVTTQQLHATSTQQKCGGHSMDLFWATSCIYFQLLMMPWAKSLSKASGYLKLTHARPQCPALNTHWSWEPASVPDCPHPSFWSLVLSACAKTNFSRNGLLIPMGMRFGNWLTYMWGLTVTN